MLLSELLLKSASLRGQLSEKPSEEEIKLREAECRRPCADYLLVDGISERCRACKNCAGNPKAIIFDLPKRSWNCPKDRWDFQPKVDIKASVIIPCCNEGDYLKRTLKGFEKDMPFEKEFIVIDDGSTDKCCEGLDSSIKLIRHKERMGCPFSRDEGFKAASNDISIFSDAHNFLAEGKIEDAIQTAIKFNAVVCCRLRREEGGAIGRGAIIGPFHEGKFHYPMHSWITREHPTVEAQIPECLGGFYIMTKDIYRRTLGFNNFKAAKMRYGEQSLAMRCFITGVPMYINQSVTIRHRIKTHFMYPDIPNSRDRQAAHALYSVLDMENYNNLFRPMLAQMIGEAELKKIEEITNLDRAWIMAHKVRTDYEFFQYFMSCVKVISDNPIRLEIDEKLRKLPPYPKPGAREEKKELINATA